MALWSYVVKDKKNREAFSPDEIMTILCWYGLASWTDCSRDCSSNSIAICDVAIVCLNIQSLIPFFWLLFSHLQEIDLSRNARDPYLHLLGLSSFLYNQLYCEIFLTFFIVASSWQSSDESRYTGAFKI